MMIDTRAVSPVIATILVLMIVTSIAAGILLLNEPIISNLEKKRSGGIMSSQFDDIASSFETVLRGSSGASAVVPMTIDSHSILSTSQSYSKTIVSYSFDNSFNFSVSDIDSNTIDISAPEDSIDKVEVIWLDDSRTCFLAGTKVLLADDSYKDIENVEIGDKVKAYDFENKDIVVSLVSNVFCHKPSEMDDFYLVINEDIKVTPNHEFFTYDGWRYAFNLGIGDLLFSSDDSFEEIFSIQRVYNKVCTYDLTVVGFHNYFILSNSANVLVHNSETGWHSPTDIDDLFSEWSGTGCNRDATNAYSSDDCDAYNPNLGGGELQDYNEFEDSGTSLYDSLVSVDTIGYVNVSVEGHSFHPAVDSALDINLTDDGGTSFTNSKRLWFNDSNIEHTYYINFTSVSGWDKNSFSDTNFHVCLDSTTVTNSRVHVDHLKVKVGYTEIINDPPIAADDAAIMDEDVSVWINVLSNDSDPNGDNLINSSIDITDGPSSGTCFLNGTTGEIKYTPDTNFSGEDSFTYTVDDTFGLASNEATVNITVVNTPDAPVVSDIPDQTIGQGNSFSTISLDDYVNDAEDADSNINWEYSGNTELSVEINDRVVTISAPDESWFGEETITFTATDSSDLTDSDMATFNVTQNPVLYLSPNQKSLTLNQNQLQNIFLYISNTGADELTYTLNSTSWVGVDWIDEISPQSGIISNGESNMITILINSTGLANSTTYTCDIVIDTNVEYNDEIFTIELYVSEESIEVISPSFGETWNSGSAHNVTWLYENQETSNINVSLYKGDVYNMTLTNNAINTNDGGNWTWNIPYYLVSGSYYSIRIENSTNDFGNSDYFTIESPDGYAQDETHTSMLYENGNYKITTANLLSGLILIELWKYGNPEPMGRIWIADSDSLIGDVTSSDGNIGTSLTGGWITSYDSSHIVKSSPKYIFNDNLFAVRLNQLVISDDSISSVQGSTIKVYLSLYGDYNREENTNYYIHLYFIGEVSSVQKDYIKTNYPSKFCDIDTYENGLFYKPSASGCNMLLVNVIFNAKLAYS